MLTDTQARKAAPQERDYKLSDSGGLFLLVTKGGAKSWRLKYRYGGKEKLLTFGLYPDVGLAEARKRRDEARRQLRENVDPAVEKQKARLDAAAAASQTFEKLARKWHANEEGRWGEVHAADVLRSLERDVFPAIGRLPISQIDTPLILSALRKVEARGSIETARRCRQRISAVFVYAISEGHAREDPAAVVAKALKPLPKKGRQPSIVDGIDDLEEMVRAAQNLLIAAEDAGASPVTKLASRLLALTGVRPGVVLGTTWAEFEDLDGDAPLWRIPARRMKLSRDRKDEEQFDHLVPLSRQAVEVVEAVRRLTGRAAYVFPNQRHSYRPMSENAIGYLYNRVGYHGRHVPHGWRAAFSTIMNEKAERDARETERPALAELDRKVIDLMLAHVPENKVEGAYNRASHMGRRREIAQEWADMICETLNRPAQLLEMPRR
jgi:integrase